MDAGLSAAAVRLLPDLTDPAHADLEPLGWLDDVVAGARVVAIGEAAHYTAENYHLRQLLLRYLVERHGFTAYALESGFAEAFTVQAWLDRATDTATESETDTDAETGHVLARGHASLMGMWTEQRELLDWLRATNARGTGVRFYGADLSGSNVSLLPALDLVAAYLDAADPALRLDPALRELAATWAVPSAFSAAAGAKAYADLPADRKDALTAGLALLLARLRARRPEQRRLDGSDADAAVAGARRGEAYDVAERAMELAVALDAYARDRDANQTDMPANVRDLAQADTVEWILRREERIVLAEHDGHVQRWPMEFPGAIPRMTTAGQHLEARLGSAYRTIGVTHGTGQTLNVGADFFAGRLFGELPPPPEGTLDAVLAASGDVPFGVDLHRLDARDRAVLAAARTQRSGPFACPIDPLAAYDALVHLPHVTATHPDPDAVAAAPAEVAAAFGRGVTGSG